MSEEQAYDAVKLTEEVYALVRPLLAGRGPALQGAVMLDLTARWLAGHVDGSSQAASRKLRERVLAQFARAVLEMAELYDDERQALSALH